MPKSPLTAPEIVIDASVSIWLILPTMAPVDVNTQFRSWWQSGIDIVAPSLWWPECTSAIRRYSHAGMLSSAEAQTAIDNLAALDIRIHAVEPNLCRSALDWSERLAQSRAYDGIYLALAQSLDAPLVSADRRLANAMKQLGETWVYWIGDQLA